MKRTTQINKAMEYFKHRETRINHQIDIKSQNGKYNEDYDRVNHHFTGTTDDGNRCWSF